MPAEPPAARPPLVPPVAATPQMTHNSNPACAMSKAYTRLYPAGSATYRCQAQTAGFATATIPPPAWRSPQSQLRPASLRTSSANPRSLRLHTPSARTARCRPPAAEEAANTPETCSTPDWSRWQKRSAPIPPRSSTAAASAEQNHFAVAHSCSPPSNLPGVLSTFQPQSLPPPADTNSRGTTTPNGATNTASPEACCNRADIACPGILGSVHLQNRTRRNRDVRQYEDSAIPPEHATARRPPEIVPVLKPAETPA